MKIAFKHINFLLLLVVLTTFFSSFAVEYGRVDGREDNPPPAVSKKEQRRQLLLDRKETKLNQRLQRTKSVKKRQAIQKKLRKVKSKQDEFGTPAIGIVGMILSILSFILFIAFIASLLAALISGAAVGLLSLYLLIGGLVTSFLGLTTSVVGIILHKMNPDKFTGKGFAIAGMIIGIVMLSVFAIAAAVFFSVP